jgi:hypothetical protein
MVVWLVGQSVIVSAAVFVMLFELLGICSIEWNVIQYVGNTMLEG